MTNHYLKAIDLLRDELPDITGELDEHASERDTGVHSDMGTAKDARDFAVDIIDDLIERLQEKRAEISARSLRDF